MGQKLFFYHVDYILCLSGLVLIVSWFCERWKQRRCFSVIFMSSSSLVLCPNKSVQTLRRRLFISSALCFVAYRINWGQLETFGLFSVSLQSPSVDPIFSLPGLRHCIFKVPTYKNVFGTFSIGCLSREATPRVWWQLSSASCFRTAVNCKKRKSNNSCFAVREI